MYTHSSLGSSCPRQLAQGIPYYNPAKMASGPAAKSLSPPPLLGTLNFCMAYLGQDKQLLQDVSPSLWDFEICVFEN